MGASSLTPLAEQRELPCLHCGLPSRGVDPDRAFCCSGCEAAYDLIHACGLERFYDLKGNQTTSPADLPRRSLAWLDALLDAERFSSVTPQRLILDLQGVHCAACVWLIQTLFRRVEEGRWIHINASLGRVELIWQGEREPLKEWIEQIESFGYRFGPPRKTRREGDNKLILRMGLSLGLAAQVMMFSLPRYFGLDATEGGLSGALGWLSFVLGTAVVLIGGWVFLKSAVLGLRRRVVHLDLPIATGIVLAYAGSTVTFLQQGPDAAYFDTVSIFVALMLVGRWLQESVLSRNRNALLDDGGVADLFTRRFREGRLDSVTAAEVQQNDELWIAPGDLVPVKSRVLSDTGTLALDWITGEPEPQVFSRTEAVPAGARNVAATSLRVLADEPFAESRLNDLLRRDPTAVPEAPSTLWSRVGSLYTLAVFLLATAGFLIGLRSGVNEALSITVAVLVVTCPCALGLGVPLARELVLSRLRREGIYLRTPGFLDRALSIRKILFDKTGTLTLARQHLDSPSRVVLNRLDPEARNALLNMTARSNHPASRALYEALASVDAGDLDPGAEVQEVAGRGLIWEREDGRYFLGRDDGGRDDEPRTRLECNGSTLARFGFVETLKNEVPRDLKSLRDAGYALFLVSGDGRLRTSRLGTKLDIPPRHQRWEMTPENKSRFVEEIDDGDTLFVGDGINDAKSFDRAFAAATPAIDHPSLPGRADFFFLGQGIGSVGRTLRAAARLRRVVRRNLVYAAVYNLIAVSFCFAGLVTPVIAAIIMPLSSVGVITLNVRALWKG